VRRLVIGLLGLSTLIAGVAGAAPINWEGTSITTLADYPPSTLYGGGVATINQTAGGFPVHLNTLRLAASRGQIGGTFTSFVTDPLVMGNGVVAIQYYDIQALTGTLGGISGAVAQTLQTINIPDAYADPRFDRAWDQATGFRTRSILCMPMRTHEGKLIGVIQVLNKKDGPFTAYDEELLGAFSTHAAIALDQARLVQAYLERSF